MKKIIMFMMAFASLVVVEVEAQDIEELRLSTPPDGITAEIDSGPVTLADWAFDDPKGNNALVTTTTLGGKELTRQVQYFKRFQVFFSNYPHRSSTMMVARTQEEFDTVMKVAGDYASPRKLNFDKELFIFVFAGKKDANWKTMVEITDVDRNGGPTGSPGFVVDTCIVRVAIDHNHPSSGENTDMSPWTMIRINKETFFKEHPMVDETKFVMFESRSVLNVANEVGITK